MIRIALCFSGQLRFVNEYSKNILKNLINLYDTDVYAHLWFDQSMIGKPFHHEFNDLYKESIDDFIRIYNPKACVTESYYSLFNERDYNFMPASNDLVSMSKESIRESIYRMESQWYSIKKSYELIENPDKYDFIIRLRTDSFITKPVVLNVLNTHTVYVQSGRQAGFDRIFCDWFALGNNRIMAKYMNIYERYKPYFSSGIIHMHVFLEKVLAELNVPVAEYEYGVHICHAVYKHRK